MVEPSPTVTNCTLDSLSNVDRQLQKGHVESCFIFNHLLHAFALRHALSEGLFCPIDLSKAYHPVTQSHCTPLFILMRVPPDQSRLLLCSFCSDLLGKRKFGFCTPDHLLENVYGGIVSEPNLGGVLSIGSMVGCVRWTLGEVGGGGLSSKMCMCLQLATSMFWPHLFSRIPTY